MPDIVLTRLLSEAAHRHVLDHAGAQRADGPGGKIGRHRGFLSRAEGCWTFDARDRMPRSSPPAVQPLNAIAKNVRTAMRGVPRERVRSLPLSDHGRSDSELTDGGWEPDKPVPSLSQLQFLPLDDVRALFGRPPSVTLARPAG